MVLACLFSSLFAVLFFLVLQLLWGHTECLNASGLGGIYLLVGVLWFGLLLLLFWFWFCSVMLIMVFFWSCQRAHFQHRWNLRKAFRCLYGCWRCLIWKDAEKVLQKWGWSFLCGFRLQRKRTAWIDIVCGQIFSELMMERYDPTELSNSYNAKLYPR